MNPIVDLHKTLTDCHIVASVAEASASNTSGKLTVVIAEGNGPNDHLILVKDVTNLNQTLQQIVFSETPKTGKIHVVKATLVLASGESKMDEEIIKLC